jgi:hypothetical protein
MILFNDEGVLDVLIMSNEAHFHLSGYINRTSGIGVTITLCRSTINLSIVKRSPYGVV